MQIKWLFVILILTTISIGKLNSQTNIDTLNLSETVLEERHLRYMYNFALNNSFFQYKWAALDIQTPYSLKERTPNEHVLILDYIFPLRIKDIELFMQPNNLQEVEVINNFEHPAVKNGLISQFDIDFIKIDHPPTRKELYPKLDKMVFKTLNVRYVVLFSNIIKQDKLIYIAINTTFPLMYSPEFAGRSTQIYEFEWCESTGWVFPRRVTSPFFFGIGTDFKRMGGTIEIPSLKCN